MNTKKLSYLALLTLVIVLVGCGLMQEEQSLEPSMVKAPTATTGLAAVAMPDKYAAQISQDILSAGGNAVDAAIAVGFALAVTFIDAGNIGGGGFMTIKMHDEVAFLDYREKAPAAAHKNMYLGPDGDVIENITLIGGQAAGVPGTVAGFWRAHQRFGTLPWKDLVSPAIELAKNGFMPAPILVDDIQSARDWFGDQTNFNEYFASIQYDKVFKQAELAATLTRIAELGADDFYRGKTAELIVAQMEKTNGLISAEDLNNYQAVWREPLRAEWRGYEVISSPPPSSGGFAIIQLLKMKDYLGDLFQGLEHNSAQYIHLVAEMEKRVFADRAEYLGDPDFVDVDINAIIDDSYIKRRAAEVNASTISALEGVTPGLESPNTTHYSIVDAQGNAVSNTYTINWSYGSGVVVEGAGFLLNNEMDDFSAKPGVPNIFGVVGDEANEIQPGKRMLSSMSPTILLKDGAVEMVLGTPGGSTIFTTVFQVIVNIIDFNMTAEEAVGATRFHHQLLPPDLITYNGFQIDRPLSAKTVAALAERGYRALPHDYEFGDVQLIMKQGDSWTAASDPRDRGVSRVFEVDVPDS
ncbi:MAG: gamma-glutamyltransferase [Gammaproteobacteria bacterium]|jgi:gamma-glutamyltranspeptidase / glutathione hydrolase|nr:gamma-glutamyltransferase [Gammaproteobacteria bacterium]MBT5203820.1 gamma-glutamyltransferase [Gammaproteobacteria bacterium]MBT5603138.1 gamma-glutamyltransferase [Gammaproteobacteria bacterium]MBT6245962.1 gamma-glutamyltransferase [Gammaproteobacteria bacterium]